MNKIHMKSAVDRDSVAGKTRTLCGLLLSDELVFADNPDGERDVTCVNCIRIMDSHTNILHTILNRALVIRCH